MSEKKKDIKKQSNHYQQNKPTGKQGSNKTNTQKSKKFSYDNNYEEFEDLDYELLDKLNKGKLIKGTGDQKKRSDQGSNKNAVRRDERVVKGNQIGTKNYIQNKNGLNKADQTSGMNFESKRNTLNKKEAFDSKKQINNKNMHPEAVKQNKKIKSGVCPYIRQCGGCNILKQSYEMELEAKQKMVEGLISKICKVEPIIGMKNPMNYRNKVHVVFDHDKKGNPISGVYEEGSHRVVAVDQCCIHNKKADEIIATIRGMLKSFKIKTYDEDTGYGLLRHVLIRTGYVSKEIMVVLVLADSILPSKNNFVKALRLKHPEISTVVINVNDKKTSMVLGEKEHVIYGKGYIEDSLCDKVFRLSPKSFYQVNPAQTEVLYQKAIDLANLTGNETVIDAYCGTGTIGIIASDHAKKVIGVELNKDAVRDANINAKRNDAKNIEFYNNDAGVFMSQMAEQQESADVVFMDPPRSGNSEQFMDAVVKLKPKKVVYISCNPITLERDLQYIKRKGYKASKAIPVDMFPWTEHVETVVLMSRMQN